MTTASEKLRAVSLTAIVVFSALAATTSFTGLAGATLVAGNTSVLTSGPNYVGQDYRIDISQNKPSEFTAQNGDNVYLMEIDTSDETVNRTVQVLEVENDEIELQTDDIDVDGRQTFALNSIDRLNSKAVNFTLEPQEFDAEWEQATVARDSESIALEVVDSNRAKGDYNVTISADGFDYEQLRALFIHPGSDLEEVTDPAHLPLDRLGFSRADGDDVSDLRAEGYITLDLSSSTDFTSDEEIIANFTHLDEEETIPENGAYDFEILVSDTTVEDTATVEIGSATAQFDEPLYTRAAGDVGKFTVTLDATDDAWVQLRGRESGFVDILYLQDDNSDGRVTFYANTRLMGTDHSKLTGVSDGDGDVVYFSDRDTVQSYVHDEVVPSGSGTAVSGATFYDGPTVDGSSEISFSEYVDQINGNTPTTQLPRPLQPTSYELVVDRRGNFVVDDGEPAVQEDIGSTVFDLVQPSVRSVETWTAPSGEADEDRNLSRLEAQLTGREEVAIGDRAIVEFETTGLVGALATIDYVEHDNEIDEGLQEGYRSEVLYELAVGEDGTDWEGEGIDFSFDGSDQVNGASNRLALETAARGGAYLFVDQQRAEDDPGTLYLVVNTETEPFTQGLDDGESFDPELRYVASEKRFEFASQTGPTGGANGDSTDPVYPYYASAFVENVSQRDAVTFQSASVTFDSATGETVQLSPTTNATLSGTTNIAPGSNATVSVRVRPPSATLPDEDPSFLARKRVTVEEDGSFEATLDLSGRVVGEQAYVSFVHDDTTIESSEAVFRNIEGLDEPFFETAISVPQTAEPNETVNMTAEVTNTGRANGTAEVTIVVDGNDAVRGIFDLEQGESRTLDHSIQMGEDDIEVVVYSQDTDVQRTIRSTSADVRTVTETSPATATKTQTPDPTPSPTPEPTTVVETEQDGDTGGTAISSIAGGAGVVALLAGISVLARRRF